MSKDIKEVYYKAVACESLLKDIMEYLKNNISDSVAELPAEKVIEAPIIPEASVAPTESVDDASPLFITPTVEPVASPMFGETSELPLPAKKDIVENLELLNAKYEPLDLKDELDYINKFARITEDMRVVYNTEAKTPYDRRKINKGIKALGIKLLKDDEAKFYELENVATGIFSSILDGIAHRKKSSANTISRTIATRTLTVYGKVIKSYLEKLGD